MYHETLTGSGAAPHLVALPASAAAVSSSVVVVVVVVVGLVVV